MGSCQDVGRVITPYLDGEAGAADREAVDAHLRVCQPCARRAEAEGTARRVVMVKAASLAVTAPDALRQRCAALAPKPQRGWILRGWHAVSLATASLVVLGLAGTLLYAVVTHSPTVMAAELILDHVKCFALFEPRVPAADAAAVASQLEAEYGWRLDVPASSPTDRLTLIGARRCLSTDGRVAHVLYRHNGRPVSLFMMPGASRPEARIALAGHVARVWTRGDTTYVMIGSESEPDLRPVAAYFQSAQR